ncbi:MAG: hypothetical protein HY241_09945 [Actinobacteria bacterium]|nr:hypothetical protein [Actinomycetota bacterium]
MKHPRHDRPLGLGEFLYTLEAQLASLTSAEITAALLVHAQRLPAPDRLGFLGIFTEAPPHRPTAEHTASTLLRHSCRTGSTP